jgi:hypothetical protein
MSKTYEFEPMLGPAEDFQPGTIEWAERMSCRLQIAAKTLNRDTVHHLIGTMQAIWQTKPRPWEIWPKEHPFLVPNDYCESVTGHDWDALMTHAEEFSEGKLDTRQMRTELTRAQIEHRSQGTRTDQHPYDIRKLSEKGGDGGTSTAYLLRRIAKKKPEILAAYERGEYPSVRAAAVAAEIISKPDPYNEIVKRLEKLSDEQLIQLGEEIDRRRRRNG